MSDGRQSCLCFLLSTVISILSLCAVFNLPKSVQSSLFCMFKMHELLSYSFNTAIVPLTVEMIDLCSNVDFLRIFTTCLRSFLVVFLHSLEHFCD